MEIRALTTSKVEEGTVALAQILCECVADGASVSFMSDLTQDQAEEYWRGIANLSGDNRLIVFGAFIEENLVGTATLITDTPPNQPHRADIAKDLLVLDTLTGSGAEALYAGLGWIRVGEIPRYALTPDGEAKATMIFYKELQRK